MLTSRQLEYVLTEDGSKTLLHRDLKVLYRSISGAKGESLHVFFNGTGLEQVDRQWTVLELGFGTGQNFAATAEMALQMNQPLIYHGIEAHPIPPEFTSEAQTHGPLMRTLLQEVRNRRETCSGTVNNVTLVLHPFRWQDINLTNFKADAIFHDPFDPTVNPDCWTQDIFSWYQTCLADSGRVATYSAAGHIRRAMRDAGLFVAKAPGYGQKREMTVAALNEASLAPFRLKYRP